jgi:hypothetical protein
MFSQQRKVCLGVIETDRFLPRFLGMTGLAIAPKGFLVFVIFAMAGNTVLAGLFPIGVDGVAGTAFGGAVFSVQRVFGVLVMPEAHGLPGFCSVTTFALLTIYPLVTLLIVVLLVAREALLGRIFVGIVFMAFRALDIGMLAR